MKTKPLGKSFGRDPLELLSEYEHTSSASEYAQSSTLSSNHYSMQLQPRKQDRSSHKHKITCKNPIFSFKKSEDECRYFNLPSSLKTGFSAQKVKHQQAQDSRPKSSKGSENRSQRTLGWILQEKLDISEFTSEKEDISLYLKNKASKQQPPCNSIQDNSMRVLIPQELAVANSPPQHLKLYGVLKDSKHPDLSCFMTEARSKMQQLLSRLQRVQSRNQELKMQIQKANQQNFQTSERIVKIIQEEEELSGAKMKWLNGYSQLQYLYKQLAVKIEREKLVQKQNMGRQECQLYFQQKSKQKSNFDRNNQGKGNANLAQRLRIKVQKS